MRHRPIGPREGLTAQIAAPTPLLVNGFNGVAINLKYLSPVKPRIYAFREGEMEVECKPFRLSQPARKALAAPYYPSFGEQGCLKPDSRWFASMDQPA